MSQPDETLLADVWEADLSIERDLSALKIATPNALLRTFRAHLTPLLMPAERGPLDEIQNPTWRNLFWLYPKYAFMAGPDNARLLGIASVIQKRVEWHAGDKPFQRENRFEEVGAFLLMRTQLGDSVNEVCRVDADNNAWLYQFCKYCWRRSLLRGLLCPEHSTAKFGEKTAANYQKSRRQHEAFSTKINQLLTRDVLEFHDCGMSREVLYQPGHMETWLLRYRPSVAIFVGLPLPASSSDDEVIERLISTLHPIAEYPDRSKQEISEINALFQKLPDLMWPLLARAEAWLSVRNERRSKQGGVRPGAGRPRKKN